MIKFTHGCMAVLADAVPLTEDVAQFDGCHRAVVFA